MSDVTYSSLEERLAALEERTAPKPKNLADRAKDWAGVGTLVIALLYTFPLGIWDRFFVTAEEKRQKEVENLRAMIVRLAEKDAEYARSYNSIASEQVRAFYSRAMSSTKTAMLFQASKSIDAKMYIGLSTSELIILGYYLGQAGKIDTANEIYNAAAKQARSEKNINFESEVYRQRGTLYSGGIVPLNLEKVEESLDSAIEVLLTSPTFSYKLQASNTAFEWGSLELSYGDWACGQALIDWAIKTVNELPPLSPEISTYAGQYQAQKVKFVKRADQTEGGCPYGRAKWLKS